MTTDDDREPCPQAWHGGLHVGLLQECRWRAGHRGWHTNSDGNLRWGGKLTAAEQAAANRLRAVLPPQPDTDDRTGQR